jgi:hypothetical protein
MAPITVHVAVVHTVRSIRLVTAAKSRAALADSTEGGRRRRYVDFLVGFREYALSLKANGRG